MVSKLGHCLEDLLYRLRTGELNMEVTAIVSNHLDMEPVAARHDIPYHLPVTADSKVAQEARLLELIACTRTELVVLARYMQIFSGEMCKRLTAGQSIFTTPSCRDSKAPSPITRRMPRRQTHRRDRALS